MIFQKHKIYLISILIISSCNHKRASILISDSSTIGIIEGGYNAGLVWEIDPQMKPDIFNVNSFKGNKNITFYSNIDTITFKVEPNKKYEFKVIQKNDTAWTRIDTNFKEEASLELPLTYKNLKFPDAQTDTIPFFVDTVRSGIIVKTIINNSSELNFLFDTGANANVITKDIVGKKVTVEVLDSTLNQGSDGGSIKERSIHNKMRIGNLQWEDSKLTLIDYKDRPFDGVLGWTAFENKVIEVDYDRTRMIIHKNISTIPENYLKIDTKRVRDLFYIKIKTIIDNKIEEGWVELDTGFNGHLYLSKEYAYKHHITNTLLKTGSSTTSGSAGVDVKTNDFILPCITIGDFILKDIPLIIKESKSTGKYTYDLLGHSLIQNFNFILDTKNNQVYIKPKN